jgi:hypothetical protein
MCKLDLGLYIVPKRRLLALQLGERLVCEHLVDRPHSVGSFRMAGTVVVLHEAGMGEEKRWHARFRMALILVC